MGIGCRVLSGCIAVHNAVHEFRARMCRAAYGDFGDGAVHFAAHGCRIARDHKVHLRRLDHRVSPDRLDFRTHAQ